jgi:protoporphyrinogen oxidase
VLSVGGTSRGPNATFRFPARDGTGGIWKAVARTLPKEHFTYNTTGTKIEGKNRVAHLSDGSTVKYQTLISTMPLDEIVKIIPEASEKIVKTGSELIFSSTHVIGIGLRGVLPDRIGDKCEYGLCLCSQFRRMVDG